MLKVGNCPDPTAIAFLKKNSEHNDGSRVAIWAARQLVRFCKFDHSVRLEWFCLVGRFSSSFFVDVPGSYSTKYMYLDIVTMHADTSNYAGIVWGMLAPNSN